MPTSCTVDHEEHYNTKFSKNINSSISTVQLEKMHPPHSPIAVIINYNVNVLNVHIYDIGALKINIFNSLQKVH